MVVSVVLMQLCGVTRGTGARGFPSGDAGTRGFVSEAGGVALLLFFDFCTKGRVLKKKNLDVIRGK
jgi:hypothetical protein